MRQGLLQSKRYRSFISDRDKALETIHQNAQVDISRYLSETLEKIEKEVIVLSHRGHQTILNIQTLSLALEQSTSHMFGQLVPKLVSRIKSLRKSIYTLSYLAQIEAITQVTKTQKQPPRLDRSHLTSVMNGETMIGSTITTQVWYDLMKLRDRVLKAFRLALVQELSTHEVLSRVKKTFPKIRVYKKAPRKLSLIKEADYSLGNSKNASFKFVDEQDWQDLVDDYKNTQLPPTRFDNEAIDLGANSEDQSRYSWEVEQTMTQDFVDQVRNGELKAAQDLGIQEFVWVAVIDDRTDDCCLERHGLTTSEIEQKLDEDDFSSDCDALYPPAHFNCRCQLSPVASAEEVEGPDWASFKDWLDS